MKIATFNINNINKRLPNLLEWLGEALPDVVCLQELKAHDTEFPRSALEKAGIEIDRKVLADLAVREPESFKALVDRAAPAH